VHIVRHGLRRSGVGDTRHGWATGSKNSARHDGGTHSAAVEALPCRCVPGVGTCVKGFGVRRAKPARSRGCKSLMVKEWRTAFAPSLAQALTRVLGLGMATADMLVHEVWCQEPSIGRAKVRSSRLGRPSGAPGAWILSRSPPQPRQRRRSSNCWRAKA
jgi:hypothetical protein